jgi:uncharacterized membrane protein YhaH (DUF805 family)
MNWYFKVFKNYFNFRGRARRKEFWMFFLFHFLIINILTLLGLVTNNSLYDVFGIDLTGSFRGKTYDFDFGIFTTIYLMLSFFPYITVSVRRFHDAGKSGYYLILYLILCLIPNFISAIGFISLLLIYTHKDEKKSEKYGSNPRNTISNSILNKEESSISEIEKGIFELNEKKKQLEIKELKRKIEELKKGTK